MAQLDRVVNCIFNLRDHVLGALKLEIAEVGLYGVEDVDRVDKGDVLLGLCDFLHQVGVAAHVLDRLQELEALLHDLVIDLDAALLGR